MTDFTKMGDRTQAIHPFERRGKVLLALLD